MKIFAQIGTTVLLSAICAIIAVHPTRVAESQRGATIRWNSRAQLLIYMIENHIPTYGNKTE